MSIRNKEKELGRPLEEDEKEAKEAPQLKHRTTSNSELASTAQQAPRLAQGRKKMTPQSG